MTVGKTNTNIYAPPRIHGCSPQGWHPETLPLPGAFPALKINCLALDGCVCLGVVGIQGHQQPPGRGGAVMDGVHLSPGVP